MPPIQQWMMSHFNFQFEKEKKCNKLESCFPSEWIKVVGCDGTAKGFAITTRNGGWIIRQLGTSNRERERARNHRDRVQHGKVIDIRTEATNIFLHQLNRITHGQHFETRSTLFKYVDVRRPRETRRPHIPCEPLSFVSCFLSRDARRQLLLLRRLANAVTTSSESDFDRVAKNSLREQWKRRVPRKNKRRRGGKKKV